MTTTQTTTSSTTITQTVTITKTTTHQLPYLHPEHPPEPTVIGSFEVTGLVWGWYTQEVRIEEIEENYSIAEGAETHYLIINGTDVSRPSPLNPLIHLIVRGPHDLLQHGSTYKISVLELSDGTHRLTEVKLLTEETQGAQP